MSESVRAAPAAPLRGLLSWYSGYRQEGVPPGRHRGLPSPYLTVIITLGDPLTVARHPDPADPPGEYLTLAGGLHTKPAIITHPGRQSGIQLALDPLGARALLGCPAGVLAGIDVDGSEVLGDVARELHERLGEAGGCACPVRAARPDPAGSRRPGPAGDPGRRRGLAAADPQRGHGPRRGAGPAGRLEPPLPAAPAPDRDRPDPQDRRPGDPVDRARRTLQREATAPAGLSPATSPAGPSLASLAAECGYYDQAHLAREFRELAGCPPSRWLAEEFRNVQSGPAPREGD